MVDTPIDPVRVPSINQTIEELDQMQAMIERGELPADFIERHFDAVDANVFGIDAKKDRHGNRIEQGIGSPGNQTANSIAAYKKYCDPSNPNAATPDPNFTENLKQLEAQLAACDAERTQRAVSLRERYTRKKGRRAS